MFGLLSKKETKSTIDAGPFQPIIDMAEVFEYVKVNFDGRAITMSMSTKTIQENKFALEELNLLKKTVNLLKKETNDLLREARLEYTDRVANRMAIIPGLGKWGRFAVRQGRAMERGSNSSEIKAVKDSVIAPLTNLLTGIEKYKLVLQREIQAGVVN